MVSHLSNVDSIAHLPQIPGGKDYLGLHVVCADEATLRHVINRRSCDPTAIAYISYIVSLEVWKIGGVAKGHAAVFRCAD